MTDAVHFSSASAEWLTPKHILDLVLEVLGEIDLDPCAETPAPGQPFNVPARVHFTKEADGLSRPWAGKVFMNPPYVRREIDLWVWNLVDLDMSSDITEAIALLPARVDTTWWSYLARFPWCAVRGRLKFGGNGKGNSAPFPSAIVYIGPNVDRFVQVFGRIGDVYRRVGVKTCGTS